MEQLKQTVTAWAILIFIVVAVIAIISGIFSSASKKKEDDADKEGTAVSETDMKAVSSFDASKTVLSGSDTLTSVDGYIKDNAGAVSEYLKYPSYYAIISDSMLFASQDISTQLEQAVTDCALFNNGYIWSSTESMRHPFTDGYLYDTNASFICAVTDICLNDGSTDFLYKTDTTSAGSKDCSNGMTVLQKLEKTADYYFDKNDLNGGGIRYNEEDGLVYILTADNNGTEGAKPSNIYFNHTFGYLDLYNNLLFNRAMKDLSTVYTMLEDTEKSEFYSGIADKNKEAINKKFWNNSLGRYVGYIDSRQRVHDLGFTAVNLMAVSDGIASKEQSEKILRWIDGEAKINTDTVTGDKVFKSKKLPVFNTICAMNENWFDSDSSFPYSGTSQFGEYWQNGGESFASALYNISARDKMQSDKKLKSNLDKTVKALKKLNNGSGEDIFALASAYLCAKEYLGIETDGEILYINPIIPQAEAYSVKDVLFCGNKYGFFSKNNKLYITSDFSAAVKIKAGGYENGTQFTLTVTDDGKILSTETVKADKDGYVAVYKRFGGDSFIMLEKVEEKKK